jgi:hypothetical protein
MDVSQVLVKLKGVLHAITRGDYDVSRDIEVYLDEQEQPKEVVDFAEQLNFMSLKLEAREMALKNTIDELAITNSNLKQSIRNSEFISVFFAGILVLTVIYTVAFSLILNYPSVNTYIPRLTELAVLILGLMTIRKSRLPLKTFGLTFKGWKQSLVTSLIFTSAVFVLMVLYRMHLNNTSGISLYEIFPVKELDWSLLVYAPVSLIQELLARGIIQTAMIIHLVHRRKVLLSIFLVACIFGGSHLNYSFELAFASFLLSFGWGYMFHRNPTIVGVALSHFLIGNIAYFMGFWDFLIQHPM